MTKRILWECLINKEKCVFVDAPVLYETKVLEYFFYPIIVVGTKYDQL